MHPAQGSDNGIGMFAIRGKSRPHGNLLKRYAIRQNRYGFVPYRGAGGSPCFVQGGAQSPYPQPWPPMHYRFYALHAASAMSCVKCRNPLPGPGPAGLAEAVPPGGRGRSPHYGLMASTNKE